MLTWILLGGVCWLLVQLIGAVKSVSNTQQLVPTVPDGQTATELLDRQGERIAPAAEATAIPPWMWMVAGMIYVICPLDFDFIPLLGWVDDLIVASLAYRKWKQG